MTISDAEYAWLDPQVATTGSMSDLEWEYYSTRSGLTPATAYTLEGHKYRYFQVQTGLQTGSISDLEFAYYSARSGLTPVGNYSLADHKYAFFQEPATDWTIAELFMDNPFYIAHRGFGDDFAEHTMSAYSNAIAMGVKAIEVSVQKTLDNQLVCFHDTTLARVCAGAAGAVSDYNYAALPMVDVRDQLGSNMALQPIPLLDDVLDAFYGRVVIFIEPKTGGATTPLQDLILALPDFANKLVWKSHYTAASHATMKAAGMKTWGYLDPTSTTADMDTYNANIDYWGINHNTSDANIDTLVAHAGVKPCIMFEIHRRSMRDKATTKGIVGMMTSAGRYVFAGGVTPRMYVDDFVTKLNAPGNIPITDNSETDALRFDGVDEVYSPIIPNRGILMGAMGAIPWQYYKIRWEMKWEVLPNVAEHSGIAFGKDDDTTYAFGVANPKGGYHCVFRGDGDHQLYRHTAGVSSGTQIGSIANTLPAPVADVWMQFEVEVNATHTIFRRLDSDPDAVISVADTTYRPATSYFHLSTGSVTVAGSSPRFRNVEILPV